MFPTHIVAVGGLISNNEGNILLVKAREEDGNFLADRLKLEKS